MPAVVLCADNREMLLQQEKSSYTKGKRLERSRRRHTLLSPLEFSRATAMVGILSLIMACF